MNPALLLPAALAALAALIVPLLIHLARRSEQRPADFAALRWLRQKPKPRHRIRFDEWPLLWLRLLLLALLALWLARPVLFIARRGLHDENDWRQWLSRTTAQLEEAGPAWRDRDWLARRHNLLVFLAVLNTQIDLNPDPTLLPLQQAVQATLRAMP